MPKELTLSLNGQLVPISIDKIDRSDLYGQILSAMIDGGEECTRVQVLMDGTILGPKSTKTALLIDGAWIEEQELGRWTPEGVELTKQESSFKSPPELESCKIEDLLNYCFKSVYTFDNQHLFNGPAVAPNRLRFSYTAGYPKEAFILNGTDFNGYMLIGEPAQCSWVGHQDFSSGDTEEWEEDDLDRLFE